MPTLRKRKPVTHREGSLPELAVGRIGLVKSLTPWLVPSDIEWRDIFLAHFSPAKQWCLLIFSPELCRLEGTFVSMPNNAKCKQCEINIFITQCDQGQFLAN